VTSCCAVVKSAAVQFACIQFAILAAPVTQKHFKSESPLGHVVVAQVRMQASGVCLRSKTGGDQKSWDNFIFVGKLINAKVLRPHIPCFRTLVLYTVVNLFLLAFRVAEAKRPPDGVERFK
jgi:hypothetical protein